MTGKQLKASILQLAIEGKLVPQDPNDEPASELLKRIAKERAKLVKEKKIKAPKPLPPIDDDEKPFDLPEGWVWCRLGEITDIEMGQSPDGGSINADRGVEFHQGKIWFTDRVIAKSTDKTSAPTKLARKNSVLLCVRAPVGKVNIVDREICIGRGLCAISPLCDMTVGFLFRWLEPFEYVFNRKATGSTFKAITKEIVVNQVVPLPPLAEQKRIVAKVEALMPLVEQYGELEEARQKLDQEFPDQLRKSILQDAIMGKLVPQDPNDEPASELLKRVRKEREKLVKAKKVKAPKPLPPITDDEKPFDLPNGWEWCRLGEIADTISSKAYQILESSIKPQGAFPVVSQSQRLIDGFCDDTTKVLNDVPLIVFGDHTRNVKYIDFPFIVGADGTKLFKVYVDAKWAYYWTLYAASIVIGSRGYGRHWKIFYSLPIPLPPFAEQKRIVAKVEELMAMCKQLKEIKQ